LSDRYYKTVSEVREVFSTDEVNGLLNGGWELLGIKEVQRDEVAKLANGMEGVARVTLLIYLLGRERKEAASSPQKPADLRPCNRCGRMIKFMKNTNGRWEPTNEDGTQHRCA
jgi:hypothetical protein